MKKLIVLPIIFLLTLSVVLAASVSRSMSSRVEPSSEVEIILTMSGAPVGEQVAIEDNIPNTITVKSWEISGSQEPKGEVSYVKKPSAKSGIDRHSWAFTASSGSPSVTYKIDAPSALGNFEFDVRWVTSDGFNHQASTLTVRTITCGDGVCEGNENSDSCEADCPKSAPAPSSAPVEEVAPPKKSTGTIFVVIVVVLAALAAGYWYKKKGKK